MLGPRKLWILRGAHILDLVALKLRRLTPGSCFDWPDHRDLNNGTPEPRRRSAAAVSRRPPFSGLLRRPSERHGLSAEGEPLRCSLEDSRQFPNRCELR